MRPEDAQSVLDIYGPVVRDTPTSFEIAPPPAEEIEYRIRETTATHPWLVCEDTGDGMVAGYAYATRFRARPAYQWSTEVSVYVHPDYQGRGLGRALYEALFDVLEHMGFARLFAGITLPNPASVRLHEALGFEAVGVLKRVGFKFGTWHDVGWWQRDLTDEPFEPERAPQAFPRLRGTPELEKLLAAASERLPGSA